MRSGQDRRLCPPCVVQMSQLSHSICLHRCTVFDAISLRLNYLDLPFLITKLSSLNPNSCEFCAFIPILWSEPTCESDRAHFSSIQLYLISASSAVSRCCCRMSNNALHKMLMFLWPPHVADADIIFLPGGFFLFFLA